MPPAPALPAADAAVFAAHPEARWVDLLLPDCNGLLRGKRVAAGMLAKVYRDGVCLPMSLIATDVTGNTVEETGLGYDIGDEDRVCRPVPGTLQLLPWRPDALQCLIAMEDGAGGLFDAAPRVQLQRVLERFRARGLTPVVAVELEFYLLDRELDAAGQPQGAVNPATGRRDRSTQVYYLQDLDDRNGFLDEVITTCQAQGIPADTAVSEYSPGQFEINLHHRADALAACDDALLLKRAIKAVAERHGLLASFMAKPFAEQAGSGLHLHVSVLDDAGNNVFACSPDAPCDPLRHAIGGLQASAQDAMLLFAPHANSYRRFVLNAFVPLNECWGFNNRTVAMRIPHSDPANTRIEHRIAGADANPYLVAAAVLAGILDGFDNRPDPGPPVLGNAYQQTELRELHWLDTVRGFLASDWIEGHFGARFRHVFGQQKLRELRNFQREISPLEVAWYLRDI
jgi:glutamine synthetase